MTAFMDAVAAGDVRAVQTLLGRQPSLATSRTDEGVSAVLVACYRGHDRVADAIIAAGADLDVFDAAALGRQRELEILLDLDPLLATTWAADGFTPLHLAAFFGHPDGAGRLVAYGADVNAQARNPSGVRPLHSAAATPDPAARLAVCALLVQAGADLNASQQGGYTALHAAAHHGDTEVGRLLVDWGADPSLTTDDGQTAAELAAAAGHPWPI